MLYAVEGIDTLSQRISVLYKSIYGDEKSSRAERPLFDFSISLALRSAYCLTADTQAIKACLFLCVCLFTHNSVLHFMIEDSVRVGEDK